ncbi:MAG: glycosyltransferase [uncultured bacterium]|uniref:Glycosyltransferase n=1 Tax=Candidatus Uhrbacteria bacterium GW2011_GWC1_41_20 TaxID=1618983 RepID=A0A0G0VJG7_9BACT|nr:MAG: glycosyltransferase [uncultured bacterium]KKR23073.1 MAG: Glycosyltransferase [Candidatus Uhrbacteria bacterium GW2011_GWE1_39_46]KKR64312.1 MAG: Glycosyltransferase [Candidatus Uhrbacteria bacterium GW2011_GWC2_40_450]KKR88252.1 MAG: Glycosyltransferase [Candidatus Uhrbacteria bacterium GW2011_GWE2_41_1153]KKR90482.1 MAG: Glycosyltransferase [Candidatus Uhrbacteria bacterium GW2011_GWD2_41_121]KKR96329.1 MAG: Glycosyltransferase [Candidatus Uhrbacteria bacterium GW2011_GWD1_41_16]KKR
MKIGIISNLYPPYQRGGAEHVVVRTVESLMDKGQDIFVITGKPISQRGTLEKDTDATERIYRFSPRNLYFTLYDYKNIWLVRLLWHIIDTIISFETTEIEKVLFREKPNAVITHNLKGIGLRTSRLIQYMGIPHIHVMHDLQLIYPSGLLIHGKEHESAIFKPAYAVYRFFTRRAFGKPDCVIFPSKFLLEKYQEFKFLKGVKSIVIPNPAPTFNVEIRTERMPGSLRLLFVGQLERHKGIRLLIKAFKKLKFDAFLNIAGEGTERAYVEREAKANKPITDLGFVSMEQLIDCLKSADALIVPSLCYENSPTVIYEALSAGVPVIASDIGGVGELMDDGKNGFLFEPGNADDLVKKIVLMNEQKEEFGKRAQEIKATIDPYSLESYTAKLLELIGEIKEG